MRKVLTALIATAAGLAALLSFRSHTPSGGLGTGTGSGALAGSGSTLAPAAPGAAGSPSASATASAPGNAGSSTGTGAGTGRGKNGAYTGTAADTQFGPVQVRITVAGGKLTDVTVLQVPDSGRYEQEIVSQALPILRSEALSNQNANINVVSGATYTSQGYAQSLQSALNQAGL
jgi:uncharacterized protein with FMN-binding domain